MRWCFILKGKCYYCNKEFSKSGILKHIKSCEVMRESMSLDKSPSTTNINKSILEISSEYNNDYWLYIAIDTDATLKDLDQFLRDVWLECCGHLSRFKINGANYESQVDGNWMWEKSENDMNVKLKDVVSVNDEIQYEYDFGSTTYLEINVVDEFICSKRDKKIEIMSRNNEQELKCSHCGETARYYNYENEKYLCTDCYESYPEDSKMIEELIYENSPRAGVCGYQGSKEDEIQYLPNAKNEKVIDIRKFLDIKEEEPVEKLHFEDDELKSAINKISNRVINHGLRKELKKWRPIEKNFSLEYHLNRFTKDELLNVARNLYIDKISSLKKEELKNKILELYEEKLGFLIENMDVERFHILLYLTSEGICETSDENIQMNTILYFRDRACLFTGTVDGEDVIIMPKELQKIILHKNSEHFRKQLERNE